MTCAFICCILTARVAAYRHYIAEHLSISLSTLPPSHYLHYLPHYPHHLPHYPHNLSNYPYYLPKLPPPLYKLAPAEDYLLPRYPHSRPRSLPHPRSRYLQWEHYLSPTEIYYMDYLVLSLLMPSEHRTPSSFILNKNKPVRAGLTLRDLSGILK